MKRIGLLLILGTSLFVTGSDVIDRIAAVVNEEVILLSELEEKLFILQSQGKLQGVDSTQVGAVRRDILNTLIEERLVVQRAQSLGIEANQQEIQTRVDDALNKVRSRFPTLEKFRETLRMEGITENMLRERYESDIRQEILGQRIVSREVRSRVEVTTDDIQRYYEEQQDQLPRKPVEVHLAHIVAYPISMSREEEARLKMEKARGRILDGDSFDTVAAETSDDPSKNRGGLLGWFAPGDLDPDFEAAVDTLDVGELSSPIRTRFGFHLIEILDREEGRFQVRHILALVEPTLEDVGKARAKIERALERLGSGESFAVVAGEESDDELTRGEGGDLGWTPAQYLLPQVAALLDSLNVGDHSSLVESDRGFHVFKILNRREGGEYEFEELKERLRTFLEQQELEKMYDEWLSSVRDSAYIEIKTWER